MNILPGFHVCLRNGNLKALPKRCPEDPPQVADSLRTGQLFQAGSKPHGFGTRPLVWATRGLDLAAVEGGVADVAAGDDVDEVFSDVGGVVADALEVPGDE